MSDSENSMDDFMVSDDASDFEEAPAPKKKATAPAAKPKAAPKAKAAPTKKTAASAGAADKKKSAPAATKKGASSAASGKKKQALEERDENGNVDLDDSDSDVHMSARPALSDSESEPEPRPAPKKAAPKNATDQYQKLSQLEHVLKRPDTYIGSTEPSTQLMWVFEKASSTMKLRQCTFVPGLYKIFDEILVNAADNKQNDATMNIFKVEIDREKGCISVYNNGRGIPVEIHGKEKLWIPELIFGHLLTSSNYDDDQKKTTGGRNGYGAKLANIYSTKFTVETADKRNVDGQGIYKQTWTDNMSKCGKPTIKDNKKGEEYTKVTFYPDFQRFNMEGLDDDTEALLMKRVYDMAGTVHGVKVYLNGTNLSTKLKGFKQYVEMYAKAAQEMNGPSGEASLVGASPSGTGASAAGGKSIIIHERVSDRWEIAFTPSDGQFSQISFVNNIATTKGGTHVEHVAKQLVEQIVAVVNKKTKTAPIKPFQVKNHLWIFVNASIENPSFDSQTKEHMTLAQNKFGSKCKVSEDFTKKVIKSGVVESVLSYAKFKQDQALKKTDGSKRSRVTGISKLEDANKAGSKEGHKCTLILTEGDSAKALAVAGIGVIGRDYYGVFPLRGKLLNVRDAGGKQLTENAEIQAIKQIMGLQHQKVYKDTTSLRYGHLMIMTDQDHDGSHIKGLIINYFDYYYPSLLKCSDFLIEFITPIVKVWKGKREKVFFTMPEYETWKDENNGGRGWQNKYYKGLGTSTASDAKKYFSDMARHRLPFDTCEDSDRALIDMAFNKKKADDRKEWLRGFVPGTFLDHNVSTIPMSDFINKELILFSMADNARSIPSVIDGLKPGQRKVLFGCFKRKLKREIKVAQLQGYVSEHTAYHHGETSLMATIIGLAQSFVGSNNINLLEPNGQFGTRLQGGKDAASPRYIFTNLTNLTRTVFNPADDPLLDYLVEDGQSIEPVWYMPILPMILVNGSDGIGTGWSSSIPNYNPVDLVENLKRKMRGEDMVPMEPWFRGFEGEIQKIGMDKYKTLGIWDHEGDTLKITELPLRTWTQSYKDQISAWSTPTEKTAAIVKDLEEHHTDATVSFTIHLAGQGKTVIKEEGIEKAFKLSSNLSTSNMVCFDAHGKIKKYSSPESILEDFYDVRLDYYHRRKANQLNEMAAVHDKLSNQARFILSVIAGQLIISKRKKAAVVMDMRKMEFKPIPKVAKKPDGTSPDEDIEEEEEEVQDADDSMVGRDSDFDYCLNMPMSSMTEERVLKLQAECEEQARMIEELSMLTPKDLWYRDLDKFLEEWQACLEADASHLASAKNASKGKGRAKAAKKKAAYGDDSGDEDDYAPTKKKASPKAKKTSPKVKKEPPAKKIEEKPSSKRSAESDADEKPAKKPPAKKVKKETVKDESEDDDDDDVFVAKKAAPKKTTAAPKKVAGPKAESSKAKTAAAAVKSKAKSKPMVLDDSDEDDEGDHKGSESGEDDAPAPPPRARTARGATKKPAYQDLDLSSEEEESDFEVDDDDE